MRILFTYTGECVYSRERALTCIYSPPFRRNVPHSFSILCWNLSYVIGMQLREVDLQVEGVVLVMVTQNSLGFLYNIPWVEWDIRIFTINLKTSNIQLIQAISFARRAFKLKTRSMQNRVVENIKDMPTQRIFENMHTTAFQSAIDF